MVRRQAAADPDLFHSLCVARPRPRLPYMGAGAQYCRAARGRRGCRRRRQPPGAACFSTQIMALARIPDYSLYLDDGNAGVPMADDYLPTVRIKRPAKVSTDDRGHSVWDETIETVQLELVSTAQLQAILQSDDDDSRGAIRQVLARKEEGVLARDPATGLFEVVSEDDLKALVDSGEAPSIRRRAAGFTRKAGDDSPAVPADELSLVSTQMLRAIVPPQERQPPAKKPGARPAAGRKDAGGGFDPYNSS